jgi:deoxyribodipyrimidine photo-lyase
MEHPIIVWFRNDLRLADHPALHAASDSPIIPVYIHSPEEEGNWPLGGASKVYLHHALTALKKELPSLLIRKGKAKEVLAELSHESGAKAVYWGRRYERAAIERDSAVKSFLKAQNIEAKSFNHSLLIEPWEVQSKTGTPYLVFTPYYKRVLEILPEIKPLPVPEIIPFKKQLHSLAIKDLMLLPEKPWGEKVISHWKVGEKSALAHLRSFLKNHAADYSAKRDFPADEEATSHLSTALHFGEISPRTIWSLANTQDAPFMRQLIWREFAYHMLYHHPHTDLKPLRPEFAHFPWKKDPDAFKAWKEGKTGYPIVDAGMRELWETGYMHNRLRMIVASFLVKDLLIPWQEGAKHFWDTLVDADLANNSFGWQWSAGCGADAAPYFRVFNPTLQSEKFDPEGVYIRKWVPELALLPTAYLHEPIKAPPIVLKAAGITMGKDYPYPLVDHAEAKKRALEAFGERLQSD